jgi:choline dehydrogenase
VRGAVGSPHLLMLSGLGQAAQLRGLGIVAVADLPEIGRNLQDHPVIQVACEPPEPLGASQYNHGEPRWSRRIAGARSRWLPPTPECRR